MQISARILLNSAESILRDRQREAQSQPLLQEASQTRGSVSRGELRQGVLESRVLNLQSSMGRLQKDYSREQMRLAYVTHFPDKMQENLLFDGEPLFSDLQKSQNPARLEEGIRMNLEGLLQNLKRLEVEMENLYALNGNLPRFASSVEARSELLNNLNPERVARLTQPE